MTCQGNRLNCQGGTGARGLGRRATVLLVDFEKRHWIPHTEAKASGRCLLCGNDLSGRRAKEHVFPRWLLEHFGLSDLLIQPTWREAVKEGQAKDQRQHTMEGLVHGLVCASCNNGWMNDLEIAVRPLLLGLADGSAEPSSLAPDQRRTLARWAVKTAATLNHSSNFHTVVRTEQARSAREDSPLLPGLIVVARQMPRSHEPALTWLQNVGVGQIIFRSDDERERAMEYSKEAWRIVLGVGRLLLLVAYLPPSSEWEPCFHSGLHTPIWPIAGTWPMRDGPMPDQESLAAETLYMQMGLVLIPEGDHDVIDQIVVEATIGPKNS
jgi:hypothetical protein